MAARVGRAFLDDLGAGPFYRFRHVRAENGVTLIAAGLTGCATVSSKQTRRRHRLAAKIRRCQLTTTSPARRLHLSIEIEPDLQRDLATAAAIIGLSVHDYVIQVLQRASHTTEAEANDSRDWARLSAASFARDWASSEDAIYDELPKG